MPRPTLITPPADDPSKSPIENVIGLTALFQLGPDIYTNTRELWRPPTGRGVYGGAVVAQCLSAAQATIPPPSDANGNATFLPHSMHCYFVLAGDISIPILYHVERVRDGRSYITRTVQARQRGKCIFTTTVSFTREGSGGAKTLEHGWDMPVGARQDLARLLEAEASKTEKERYADLRNGVNPAGPFEAHRMSLRNLDSPYPQNRKPISWVKCKGKIAGGIDAHLSALAYMSDSWFIGTVARAHQITWENNPKPLSQAPLKRAFDSSGQETDEDVIRNTEPTPAGAQTSMVVSLDHTIYFHRPRETLVDEWLCSEMEAPWSGQGRGLVFQRIWTRDGRLVASCVQEGLVRLKQDAVQSKL